MRVTPKRPWVAVQPWPVWALNDVGLRETVGLPTSRPIVAEVVGVADAPEVHTLRTSEVVVPVVVCT